MATHKKIIGILAATLLLAALAGPALALELQYPAVGGYNATPNLTKYMVYLFMFVVASAVGIAILSLVIGGLRWIASGFNPAQKSEASKRILDSVLGIVLLLSSVVLLGTINNELTILRTTPSPFISSLYIVTRVTPDSNHPDGKNYVAIPSGGYGNLSDFTVGLSNIQSITYRCDPAASPPPKILIFGYKNINFMRSDGDEVIELSCNKEVPFANYKSLQWVYKQLGVYFYAKKNCAGTPLCDGDDCTKRNDGTVPVDAQNKSASPQSFQIVSGSKDDEKYGIVIQSKSGECSIPYLNNGVQANQGECINIQDYSSEVTNGKNTPFQAYSASIIKPAAYYDATDDFNGVTFYSAHYAVDYPANMIGYDIGLQPSKWPTLDALLADPDQHYQWNTKTDPSPDECTSNDPNAPCVQSSDADGLFYIILYAQSWYKDKSGNYARECKVFTKPIQNLFNDAQFKIGTDFDIYDMHIIPYGGG